MSERSTSSQRPPRMPRRRACDSCSQKKIKCDAGFPQCNWCEHHSLACTYNRIRKADGSQATLSSPTVTYPDPSISSGLVGQGRPGNPFLNTASYLKGHHVFSDEGQKWIESQTGERINFDRLFSREVPWLKPLHSFTGSASTPLPELPSRADLERYIQVYCSSFQSLVFPVLSRWNIGNTISLAYNPAQPFGSASAKSCLYSFLSLVSLFGFDDSIHGAMDCRSFASAAQSFMTPVMQEMTVDGLQSLIMLVQLQYFLGDLQSAAITLSIATRLLYTLGAHKFPSNTTDTNNSVYDKSGINFHLRDLFWLCYSFDKDICLRTGEPPCMNDTHCNLTLPPDYIQHNNTNLQRYTTPMEITNHTIPLFPWDIRLSMLKARVYQNLYSADSLDQSVSELLSNIRSLDESLEQWRLSLPADFRPTLYFSSETPVSVNVNTQAVMLRLAYYHCVISIHQASSRRQSSEVELAGPPLQGITSSIGLSITASRSTLSYLQRVLPVVKGECFWVILFYATTAVLTLFCNIISNPDDADTQHNVELLQSVPELIHRIPIRKLTLGEVIHLQYLDGFTTELVGICARAISRRNRLAIDQ